MMEVRTNCKMLLAYYLCLTAFPFYVYGLECGLAEQSKSDVVKNAFSKCFIQPPSTTVATGAPSTTAAPSTNSTDENSTTGNGNSTQENTNANGIVVSDQKSKQQMQPSGAGVNGTSGGTMVSDDGAAAQPGATNGSTTAPAAGAANGTTTADGAPSQNGTVQNGTDQPEIEKKCIIFCLFTNLGMTDEKGTPKHQLVTRVLLKDVSGRELRDFIEDSIDTCFQETDSADKTDSCQYTNSLASCLAIKARTNCADWTIFDMPFLQ